MAKDRAASEEEVLVAVRKMLPGLAGKDSITISLTNRDDTEAPDESIFKVLRSRVPAFACRRGS